MRLSDKIMLENDRIEELSNNFSKYYYGENLGIKTTVFDLLIFFQYHKHNRTIYGSSILTLRILNKILKKKGYKIVLNYNDIVDNKLLNIVKEIQFDFRDECKKEFNSIKQLKRTKFDLLNYQKIHSYCNRIIFELNEYYAEILYLMNNDFVNFNIAFPKLDKKYFCLYQFSNYKKLGFNLKSITSIEDYHKYSNTIDNYLYNISEIINHLDNGNYNLLHETYFSDVINFVNFEYEDVDETDYEKNIMRAFRNGMKDNIGY